MQVLASPKKVVLLVLFAGVWLSVPPVSCWCLILQNCLFYLFYCTFISKLSACHKSFSYLPQTVVVTQPPPLTIETVLDSFRTTRFCFIRFKLESFVVAPCIPKRVGDGFHSLDIIRASILFTYSLYSLSSWL